MNMHIVLLLICAVFMANGSYIDDIDREIILAADSNICCKSQTTEFECINGATREKQRNSCVWLDLKDPMQRLMADRWRSRCLVRRFYDCKYDNLQADCTGDDGNACKGSDDPSCTNRTVACSPTYDTFDLYDISVSDNNQIGEVNIFNNHIEINMKFTTPKKKIRSKVAPFLVIGDAGLIKFSLTKKNKMAIYVNGVKGSLGTKFKWKFDTLYHLELTIKKGYYAKVTINNYKQKSRSGSPDMGFHNGFSEVLPVLASSGTNVADGTFINSLAIKTWMYDPSSQLEQEDEWDVDDEYMVYDDEYYEYEEDQTIFSIAIFGEDATYSSLMHLKLTYVFAAITVLCVGCYYFYWKIDKGDKYIPIDDGAYVNRI